MKAFAAFFALIVCLLITALVYQRQQAIEVQSSLDAVVKDRDAMNTELRKLKKLVTDLQRTAVASASAAATRPEQTAPATEATTTPPANRVARPGVTEKAPAGWAKNGAKSEHYVSGVDNLQTWGGMPSAYVESLTPSVEGGFGGMMQTIAAENYVGKRIKLSGWVKTEEANQGGGHLWLRIDGQDRGKSLGFDNMDNRPIKGTTDWQEASVVLDVPAGASALAYGFFVSGGGKMWVNGQRIEEVGPEVPTTNMIVKRALPRTPINLGFDPNRPK
jgi:hypothetical protein